MTLIFFENQTEFRNWLIQNHKTETELYVGYYKKASGKPSMTWSESVDQALCFGWIDGIRRSVDDKSYCIRFTPRKPKSIWSPINIAKVAELIKLDLMQEAGIEAFSLKNDKRSEIYNFEKIANQFLIEYEQKFKNNSKAWQFFYSQALGYQKMIKHWIMTAKQEKTQLNRLEKAINESENNRKLF